MPTFYSVVELEIDDTTIQSNSLIAKVLEIDESSAIDDSILYPTLRALLDSRAGSWTTKIESVERSDGALRVLFLGSSDIFEPVKSLMLRLAHFDNSETIRSVIRYVTPYRYGYAELVGRGNGLSWSVSRSLSEELPDGEIERLLLKSTAQAAESPHDMPDWQKKLSDRLYEVVYPEPNQNTLDILKATGSIQLHPLYKFWFDRKSNPNLVNAVSALSDVRSLEQSWARYMPDWAAKWAAIRSLSKDKDIHDPDSEDVKVEWSVCQ